MSRPLVIEIGQVRIDARAEPEDADRIEATLREGLRLLGERLETSTFARDPEALAVAIDAVTITDLTIDSWVGRRGAERVADALYRRITAGRFDHGR